MVFTKENIKFELNFYPFYHHPFSNRDLIHRGYEGGAYSTPAHYVFRGGGEGSEFVATFQNFLFIKKGWYLNLIATPKIMNGQGLILSKVWKL